MRITKNAGRIVMLITIIVFSYGCKKEEINNSDVKVTTYTPQGITSTSATCGGDVIVAPGLSLNEIGICWATSSNPTVDDAHLSSRNWNEPYVCTINCLTPNTKYHVRAYVLRGLEYYYGENKSFTTLENSGVTDGALEGLFSVSETKHVCFSKGNLQYQASTNTWRFAENQWDIIGEENINVSSAYPGWIDFFGWGTSGFNHGAICYQPYSISGNYGDYYAYGNENYNLYDRTSQADWGYNPITNGGNALHQWRTLSQEEWVYLFEYRTSDSGPLYTKAKVNGVNGRILLPDNWDESIYDIQNNPNPVLSESEWMGLFEANGAVFLPAAGYRHTINMEIEDVRFGGFYWGATSCGDRASAVHFDIFEIQSNCSFKKSDGLSVRLVYDIN